MKPSIPCIALLVLSLSACGERASDPVDPVPGPAADGTALHDDPAAPPPLDQPDVAVPPANAPGTNIPQVVDGVITFEGFGPAGFGADAEQVRMAWGNDLGDAQPSEPGGCYYLIPQPLGSAGYRIAFMVEGDRFSRIDVRNNGYTAPGGGKVGMDRADIDRLYAGRVEASPHKYVDGAQYLRVRDGGAALVFETDADGKVTEWRIGVPPQVDYVEGCS
ncbi:lectin [Luteimonas sp. BDR2-5]|uniref:lectin n=1 Tax=Proluteimonas luteida TaxID=2878685 RepID=UPI001E29E9F9|nr:lectin [Luteimonas sp. BDR2-5]MCD9029295.1 lectin [Luteimonas sp. BDR2-5]